MLSGEPSQRLQIDLEEGENVWAFVERHRHKTNSINHGKGFPNWKCPDFIKKYATNSIENDFNQYAPHTGLLSFKQVLAKRITKNYQNKFCITPQNIQITNGCFAALDSTFRAFLNDGDEVILIEPFFTFYKTQICHNGGKIVTISLSIKNNKNGESEWKLNTNQLKE
eukprot:167662_1